MHMYRHATVTEGDFFSGFRAFFPSWSQKYPREGRGEKVLGRLQTCTDRQLGIPEWRGNVGADKGNPQCVGRPSPMLAEGRGPWEVQVAQPLVITLGRPVTRAE